MGRLRPKSSTQWLGYFQLNARQPIDIPWERGAELTSEERENLAASIQEFQLGESSDGRRSLAIARRYAEEAGDPVYPEAVAAFFREENRHAAMLGRFLELAGLPLQTHSWRDSVFRHVRRCFNLETLLALLLTAELIAKVYYRALFAATQSKVLRQICAQILRDEKAHVRFHFERFARLRRYRPRWLNRFAVALQRLLFAVTCVVVWLKHGRAMRRGGFGWRRFFQQCDNEFSQAAQQMDPRAYCFDAAEVARHESSIDKKSVSEKVGVSSFFGDYRKKN